MISLVYDYEYAVGALSYSLASCRSGRMKTKQEQQQNNSDVGLPLYDVNDRTVTVVLAEEIALSSFFLG